MSATKIALLGAIAGFTIFLGLPIGRMRNPAPRLRALLNAVAVGILLFLLWDVLAHAWDPVDAALGDHHYVPAVGNGLVLALGVATGLLGLVYFDRWTAGRRPRPAGPRPATPNQTTPNQATPRLVGAGPVVSEVGASSARAGTVGAATGTRLLTAPPETAERQHAAAQLALMIAVGIGLHNFAEGLAIGNSAATGQIGLAVLLIIGFGLHNATEGFGIVAPMAAAGVRPSWTHLGMLGLIGGGPTLAGTLVGQHFTNDTISIAFLALAAGSILYVVVELLAVARRIAPKDLTTWGLLLGLIAGFLTDAIVTAGGA